MGFFFMNTFFFGEIMTTAMNTIGILLILNFSGGSRYKVYIKEILYFGNPINSKFTRMSTWYPSTHAKTKLWKTDFFFFYWKSDTFIVLYELHVISFPWFYILHSCCCCFFKIYIQTDATLKYGYRTIKYYKFQPNLVLNLKTLHLLTAVCEFLFQQCDWFWNIKTIW